MTHQDVNYYPLPESHDTFRFAETPEEKMNNCGMDAEKLGFARQFQFDLNSGDSFGVVALRNGWMVEEYYTYNVLVGSSFDIWSGTKSFTSMAYACLIEESKKDFSLSSRVYDFIPDEYHIEDTRRREITLEQLLSMTSGLRGISDGGVGMGVPYGHGAFEYALGQSPNRRGFTCDLMSDPGTRFDYCDAGYTLLSLAFFNIAGEDMRDFVNRKILSKIGIENFHWDMQGGNGFIGPYTNAHTGLHLTVRDLARVGYLLLRNGVWEEERILPETFFKQISRANPVNPRYVSGFWKNHDKRLILGAPEDTYFMNGFRSNRCYIIPSLDLVISRCGTGPAQWNEGKLIEEILASVV